MMTTRAHKTNLKIRIRNARPEDLGFLIEGLEKNRKIEKRTSKEIKATRSDRSEFRTAIRKRNVRVVDIDGRPVAFLYFRTDFKVMYIRPRFFWVDLVYVDERHRGKGYGKLLYEDAGRIAKKRKLKTIVIDIFESNENSRSFHANLGFRPIYTIFSKRG